VTLAEAINAASAKLTTAGIPTARRDAEVLLSFVLLRDRAWLFTHIHDALDDEAGRVFEATIRRRALREPLQYVTGRQEFWGLEFTVTPDVLIPRPETELLVETALKIIGDADRAVSIIDLCAGSGCIAVCLAKELPSARIFATDLSGKALSVARENARKHGVLERILFLEGDLFRPLEKLDIHGQVDIIASNPPYVRSGELRTLQPEVRDYEPEMALVAGPEGTEIHQKIINEASEYLKPHGVIIMELGLGQAEALVQMCRSTGRYDVPEVYKDLAGIERVIVARRL
jgi:release factor glutamine methyltransferase